MIKIIDIGHRKYSTDIAMSILETEVSKAAYQGNVRMIKIVHGHGTGALRTAVRTWCKDQEGRFQAVIYGEDYDAFHRDTAEMRTDSGHPNDSDLGRKNRAVTYLWLW
ncbi:MAG: Smr/MutS family protein [Candidatus Marinimicrobia bacterium]|nr:Smr/MutS family protein [Candidatus Neomarinimicrobiota bacterium]